MRACGHAAACTILLIAAGCSTLPTDIERPESYALTDTDETLLARITDPAEADHSGQSGFHLLPDGLNALETRLAMVDLVEGLDEYHLFHSTRAELLRHYRDAISMMDVG